MPADLPARIAALAERAEQETIASPMFGWSRAYRMMRACYRAQKLLAEQCDLDVADPRCDELHREAEALVKEAEGS